MRGNRSMPRCTVIPELGYPDVNAAAEWLCLTFGFRVRLRIGNHRVQLHVGDDAVVLYEAKTPAPASIMVRVEDVDQHCRQARMHGAAVLREPADYPYGERQYSVADPAGHCWNFSQSIADVDPASWGGELIEP